MDKSQLIEEAIEALRDFEVGREQLNERSAMTLLALLQLKPGDDWARATNPMLGTRAIMDWIRDQYGVEYAANTRETIRRFTLHQFVIAQLVEENADRPDRPINSPKWNYRVTDEALEVLRHYRDLNPRSNGSSPTTCPTVPWSRSDATCPRPRCIFPRDRNLNCLRAASRC